MLITDLFEGGNAEEMIRRAATIVSSGVRMVCLLALNDTGAPMYDAKHAAQLPRSAFRRLPARLISSRT